MGYSTDFTGELKFVNEVTAPQLAALKKILGEDCRDHPEWGAATGLTYIDLELADDFEGLRWNGAEKTYDLHKLVNIVLGVMRARWPAFGLRGNLFAQGEESTDRWMLTIGDDGLAHKVPVALTGKTVKCPHCHGDIALEG